MNSSRNTVLSALFSLALLGCSGDTDAGLSYTRSDSAGVTLVMSHGPEWKDGTEWTITSEPLVQIGVVDGPREYRLDRVLGVTRLADGRIAVLNGGDQELRFYDRNGAFLQSVGGEGGGPGELRRSTGLHRTPGDTLVVASHADTERSYFSPTGEFLKRESFPYASLATLLGQVFGCPRRPGLLPDGSYLACAGIVDQSRDGSQDLQVSHYLVRVPFSLDWADTLGVLQGPEFGVNYGSPGTQIASRRDPLQVFLGDPATFTIAVLEGGRGLVQSIRYPQGISSVTEDQRQEYVAYLEEWQADRPNAVLSPPIEDRTTADVKPGFQGLIADESGSLWAIRFSPPWDSPQAALIFGPEGQLLGEVAFPPGLEILEVGKDYVLGISRDEFDVEQVAMYQLNR